MAVLKKEVAVIVQSSREYGRGVIAGIAAYIRAHRGWSIYHDERVLTEAIPIWLQDWRGDGLIAGFENDVLVRKVQDMGIPAVDLHGESQVSDFPVIRSDGQKAVELAYTHLRKLGFYQIAYCGFSGIGFSDEREGYLKQLVAEEGIQVATLDSRYPHAEHSSQIEADGFKDQQILSEWLTTLPTPVGVIACNDNRAAQVLNAARQIDLSVPDQLGVVGIDNDACVCSLCNPPLSSVDLNTVRVGFQAAQTLDAMMNGKAPGFDVRRIEPSCVVARESTNLMVVDDPDVAEAIRYIHENASSGISVNDVVKQVAMSRSTLERHFSQLVGRSIKTEINRVRLQHVKELLVGTSYSLEQIAQLVNFSHAEYMIAFFKKAVGTTPGEYRKERRQLPL